MQGSTFLYRNQRLQLGYCSFAYAFSETYETLFEKLTPSAISASDRKFDFRGSRVDVTLDTALVIVDDLS